ncbi:MAG TPA: IS5 family transposase [Pseudolabrys sp.]|nr:IS5 family transposase [Pseudolabrys sp.]
MDTRLSKPSVKPGEKNPIDSNTIRSSSPRDYTARCHPSVMKIMAIVDRHGLPLSVSTHAANHHEVRLVQLCFDFYMIEAKPENLIGDRAYDSDPLDAELRKDGIEMIAPHRGNRSKPATQDRRRLSRYMRRWLVERFFAWIQWQRRILIRWEYHAHNFLGFVQLACLVILFKRF